ncbi:MAG: hypothetical protein ACKOLA_07260, partial [Spartobacteria bacterium]
TGPGSYNGLRASIAAAWGLARARGASLKGIPSVFGYDAPEYFVIGDARARGSGFSPTSARARWWLRSNCSLPAKPPPDSREDFPFFPRARCWIRLVTNRPKRVFLPGI